MFYDFLIIAQGVLFLVLIGVTFYKVEISFCPSLNNLKSHYLAVYDSASSFFLKNCIEGNSNLCPIFR